MCVCGTLLNRRQWLTMTMAAAAALADSEALAEESTAEVHAVLRTAVSVDLHTHAAGMILRCGCERQARRRDACGHSSVQFASHTFPMARSSGVDPMACSG